MSERRGPHGFSATFRPSSAHVLRHRYTLAVCLTALAPSAHAQAPTTAFPVLQLPSSARAAALGDAWVAGRDDYAIFSGPALVSSTNGIGATFARYAPGASGGAVTSATTVGSITFGWGVHLVELRALSSDGYPFAPTRIGNEAASRDGMSLAAIVAANRVFKGFRTGVAVKYAEDRIDPSASASRVLERRVLADIGTSHSFLSGTAALAVQNVDDGNAPRGPMQASIGWSRQFRPGPLDIGVVTQVLQRQRWTSPAAGVEVGYGWIEGYNLAFRAGARRPETTEQRPFSLGAGLSADRLGLDYALQPYAGGRVAHYLGVRWR